MKIFAIGDLHLSFFEGIEKPMDVFGSSWAEHESRLKENWESMVTDDDIVIICGDLSWGLRLEETEPDFKWISELPGKKIIFKGNHDLYWQSAGKMNRCFGSDNMVFIQNGCYLIEGEGEEFPIAICGSRGWTSPGDSGFKEDDKRLYDRELIRLKLSLEEAKEKGAKTIIGVLHFPPTNDKLQPSGFTDLMTEYGVKTVVYGHLHGKDSYRRGLSGILNNVRYELVSLDYLEARPKEIEL